MCANSIITVDGETASALTGVVGFGRSSDAPGVSGWSRNMTIASFIGTANGDTPRSTFWANR